jgi:hypothetical protein
MPLFPLVQFLYREQPFFVKQLDEGVEERGGFKGFCGVVVEASVGVEETGGEVVMDFR